MASSPRINTQLGARQTLELRRKARLPVHRPSACSGVKALRNTSDARRQAAKLRKRFGPLTPSARSGDLIAGDGTKNGLSRSEQKTVSTTQNNRLTGKAPYKSTANLTAEDVTGQHDRRSVPPRLEGSIVANRTCGGGSHSVERRPLTVARERHERLGLAREGNHIVAV